ncbi:MAG: choline ABC transporter ATP-binding protein [Alphaproteobacteria bacterium]|nr:choline ABC transporter ATP-binding protein [Alphaproteobacteria bacterium]
MSALSSARAAGAAGSAGSAGAYETAKTAGAAVSFRDVDIIFAETEAARREAVGLLDGGAGRDDILERTGAVIGVAGASLDVRHGEISVLMGLSGSGKSTLLRAVNGLNKVTRGAVEVSDGAGYIDMARCDAAELRRMRTGKVAMVFQQFGLLPWRTVAENVGLGLELRGVAKAERDQAVREKLELVDLTQWADKYAHELSGGMQQRVGLARAFATDADILLMDEPFSALDPLIRTHLQEELLGLQERLRKTIIFVSHDLDEALKLGNRIAIMDAGRIVQYGEPEDIVLNPASDYVAEFVAHMNPLDVLKGAAMMTPLSEMRIADGAHCLDESGRVQVTLDKDGAPESARAYGLELTMVDPAAVADRRCLALAPVDVTMRQVIDLRRRSGAPVLLMEDGKAVGVCGDEEIYRGILRRPTVAEPEGVGA